MWPHVYPCMHFYTCMLPLPLPHPSPPIRSESEPDCWEILPKYTHYIPQTTSTTHLSCPQQAGDMMEAEDDEGGSR